MNTQPKLQEQLSLEAIIKQNKEDADRLQREADFKLKENARIQEEMGRILRSQPPPPVSRLMDAFTQGVRSTMPPAMEEPVSVRLVAEKEVLYAALAIVRSWKRRKKKNWQNQEKELVAAVERLTWDK